MDANNPEQKIFRYPPSIRLLSTIFNGLAFIMPFFLAGGFLIRFSSQNIPVSPTLLSMILFNVVFAFVVLIFTANFFSEITADKNGLHIQFLWLRLPVLWQDIIEIKPSFLNLPGRPTLWVIQTKKLTPFHRLYGLVYALSFSPCFTLYYGIENREIIMEMIKKHRYK